MEKIQSLAEFLGTAPAVPDPGPRLEDITDAKAFAEAVLSSKEFRQYIVGALTLGELPPQIILRMMDYAWGKPSERVEHTGPHGRPIETIKIVRVVVDPQVTVDEMPEELQREIFH